MTTVSQARLPARTRPSGLGRSRVRSAWLFLAPTLAVLAVVAAWPLARTLWFSVTDAQLTDLGSYNFIGLDNYLTHDSQGWNGLLVDPDWWHAVWNTLWFTGVSVGIETVLGLAVALVLNAAIPGRGLVRAAILVPWSIPTVVSARMWAWMLNDQFGILNDLGMRLGLLSHPMAWIADPRFAMWAVVIVDVWKSTPFMTLLCLAALQMLPADCYEAARLDGVGPVKLFFRVTLPLIRQALVVAVIFRALDALRIFDLIYVLTGSAQQTMSMAVFARQQLVDFQSVGYGSAASTALLLVIALVIAATLTATRVRLEGEAG